MTPVVVDASAGAEIVIETRRGNALARLIPAGAQAWVPEHFYVEVLSVIRRQALTNTIPEAKATTAVSKLRAWPLRTASVPPLLNAAWAHRHNMTAADAVYVVLVEQLRADFLTDDHNLVDGPTFPSTFKVRASRRPNRGE